MTSLTLNKIRFSSKRLLIVFFVLLFNLSYSQPVQTNWENLFQQSYYGSFKKFTPLRQYWLRLSQSNNVEDLEALSYGLDAILAMYETTDSLNYLDDAIYLVQNNINMAQVTNKIPGNRSTLRDNYKGWIENRKDSTSGIFHMEVPLDEIYFYQYACRLLKDINKNKILIKRKQYKDFYTQTLNFIETNIWDKWTTRGIRDSKDKYAFLMLKRTHMASHWAYIAAELYFLTKENARKIDYLDFVNFYNKELENNFNKYGNYIFWNQTWDSIYHTSSIIQDVSHGNLVVSYLVEAYDLGLWSDLDAIQRIINTLKYRLWDANNCIFRDNLDGTRISAAQALRSNGSFQADGFVKLTRYDKSLFAIYNQFIGCSKFLTAWYQYGQLFANLALSEKLLHANFPK